MKNTESDIIYDIGCLLFLSPFLAIFSIFCVEDLDVCALGLVCSWEIEVSSSLWWNWVRIGNEKYAWHC